MRRRAGRPDSLLLPCEDPGRELARLSPFFECLRTYNDGVNTAVIPEGSSDVGGVNTTARVAAKGLSISHSVCDQSTLTAISSYVQTNTVPDRTCVFQPTDLASQHRNSSTATGYWQKFHSIRHGSRHEDRSLLRDPNHRFSSAIWNEGPRRPPFDAAASSMADAASIVQRALSIASVTVLTVHSNMNLLNGRIPGACLADDIFFTLSAEDLSSENLSRICRRRYIVAAAAGVYDYSRLQQCANFIPAAPHFYRDLSFFYTFYPALTADEPTVHPTEYQAKTPWFSPETLVNVEVHQSMNQIRIVADTWIDDFPLSGLVSALIASG